LETLGKQSKEKLEEAQGTTRNSITAAGLHTLVCIEVRDEFITIRVRVNMCKDP